jgi:hypothetical protein
MSWYRDFSTFFQGLRSIPILFEAAAKTGKMLT